MKLQSTYICDPCCALSACLPAALPNGREPRIMSFCGKNTCISKSCPAKYQPYGCCWQIVGFMIEARMRNEFYLLHLKVTHTVGVLPHTLTSCNTYCMWATYVSQHVPHMCHNICPICVTTCPIYVSQLVPHLCHILSTEVQRFP